jgi:Xaa-Pro aminopeptidase
MKDKLAALRRLMKRQGIAAYLVPSTDPHQSEYVPEFWKRRQFLTGFTGSAGDALVTEKKAALWTDSRYFLQAERELRGTGFALFRLGRPGVPSWPEWIVRELSPDDILGLDPKLITHREYSRLEKELKRRRILLRAIEKNLVDAAWEQRPMPPAGKISLHPRRFAGESVRSKLNRLRQKMVEEGADAHVLSQLDAIAWLFNTRGSDVEFNPVAIAYAVVTPKKATLFIDRKKITKKVGQGLRGDVTIEDYEDFAGRLFELRSAKRRVWLDEASASEWLVRRLGGMTRALFKPSPVHMFKAVKNRTEIAGARKAHLRDGVAMVRFLCWLEREVPRGGVTELSAARKAEECRGGQEFFQGPSFKTISSYGSHGAVVHYAVSRETDVPLKPRGVYLIDSGGQYLEATTDITRTACLGRPNEEHRDRFTRVLQGLIRLSELSFPRGTCGPQVDILARLALWDRGLNYGHGTGHGVGAYLGVHEGPQSIAPSRGFGVALEPGMVTTIEPGYYKENAFGLRLENMVLVVRDQTKSSRASVFHAFETLTLCPIDLRLVKRDLLAPGEVLWLNRYHRRVRNALMPHLAKTERVWLKKATRVI